MASSPPVPWIISQVKDALDAFCRQLRSGIDGTTKIPNLDWSVSDLAAHVACLPSHYRRLHDKGAGFEPPDNFAAYSDAARAHITETSPAALAELVQDEFEGHIGAMTDLNDARWLYGIQVTEGQICALWLSELIVHGQDLSAVTGAPKPELTRAQANAVVDAVFVITPAFIDPDKTAAVPDGTYHLSFRGGRDYTWVKAGRELAITLGKPAKADARLNADPATFLLSSYGRISDVRAGLSGGLLAYGRKPWRFIALGNITTDGV